jgi:molybdopterin synthase catalytic subunit
MSFRVSVTPLDPEHLKTALSASAAGACVCFEGWVRDHNEGESVRALEYEAHEALATKEGQKILDEAAQRFSLQTAAAEHRIGHLEIGDCAVWVGVASSHRGEAFAACRYIIDELKSRLPVWKKEHYVDGQSGWINCVTGDAVAADSDRPRQA